MAVRIQSKKQVLLAFLERGVAMIHLDARKEGVMVPHQYQTDPHLRLNLSYRYGIPDLDVNDERVQATLSFGGRGFRCVLPWDAIFAVTSQASGDGQVWPEDLPTELAETPPPAASVRPALEPVDGGASEQPQEPAGDAPASAPKKRGHLRLVR